MKQKWHIARKKDSFNTSDRERLKYILDEKHEIHCNDGNEK